MAAEQQHVVENEENCGKNLKRKRENSVLDTFTKLTNVQEKIRIKSGVELLKHLTDYENSEKGDSELKYALGRLIRGLGSSNCFAKTGFFAALVGLLNLKNVAIEEILEHVSKELQKSGSNSKGENADVCSGQILVAGAVLRSNLYEKCHDEDKIKVLEMLLNAGKERTYLSLASYKFLIDLYEKIGLQEFEKLVFPIIKNELSKPWPDHNLDTLYLLVETQSKFPQFIKSEFLKNSLGTAEILCLDSLYELCDLLTTIPRILALKHPIFDLFIQRLSESDLIIQFFETLDQTLARPNRNRYFVFTKLLTGILQNIKDTTIIPLILTKNYIQQTIETYKTAVGKLRDKEFQQATQKLFGVLLDTLKSEGVMSKTKITIIKKLLFYPGTFIFEKVTKSKLIQSITATLDSEGVKELGVVYCDVVLATKDRVMNENRMDRWWNVDRIYASRLLVKLINHASVHEEIEWKVEQLIFLMKLGLLNGQSELMGNELADSLKETFYSSLDLKLTKLDDFRTILSKIVHELDSIVTGDNFEHILRHPLSPESYETWKSTVEIVTKLETKTKKRNVVFHILFLQLGLQVFNNSKLATDSLKELFSCYERIKMSKSELDSSSDDPLWIEVVVDLFLNLLSHNSHLLRSVINCVFPYLCKYMNATAIHQILSVLDPKNESNPLSKTDEETDDEGEGDESADSDSSSDDEAEEGDEDEDNVNDKLRMALQQALGNTAESDAESIDLDNLDEEEGERLDEALGQAFKQFKPNLGRKKKQSKDEEILTHFRIRVLDLIEIYLNSNPSMLLTLEIMMPLLQILEFSIRDEHQMPLQDRVRACLKKLSSLKKFSDYDGVSEEVLIDLLKSLLDKGTKNALIVQEMDEKIAECCIFIINCSQIVSSFSEATPKKKKKSIDRVIRESLEAFFTKRDSITPYVLFKNVMQMNWEGILGLVPILNGFVFVKTVRPFRRNQAIELLKLFYNNHRFLNSHREEIKKIEENTVNFLLDSVGFFKEFCGNPSEQNIREKFICLLFEVLSEIKTCILGDSFKSWDAIAEAARDCRSQITISKDTKVAYKKLCKKLNVSNIVQMKQNTIKLNSLDEGVKEGTNKQRKRKKNGLDQTVNGGSSKQTKRKKNFDKNRLKLKKESKELRLQSLSEGLSKRKIDWEDTVENKKIKTS